MREFKSSFAGPASAQAGYCLEVFEEPGVLAVSFEVHQKPAYLESISAGTFYEGLWRYDCGELWLYSPSTQRYVEFNLAPNGAWWASVFSSPRIRDESCIPPICDTSSVERADAWFCSLKVEISEIKRCLGTIEDLHANVTLILGGCPDFDVPLENLHTIVPLPAVNFHMPGHWLPIGMLLTDPNLDRV